MSDSWDLPQGQTQYDPKDLHKTLHHKEHYEAKVTGPFEDGPTPQRPSPGRIVHYVLSNGRSTGEHRPGMIVRVWSDTYVQLQVFTDSANDFRSDQQGYDGLFWATSVAHDEDEKKPGTWHWPERV